VSIERFDKVDDEGDRPAKEAKFNGGKQAKVTTLNQDGAVRLLPFQARKVKGMKYAYYCI